MAIKKTPQYRERDEIARENFRQELVKIPPEDCFYIDESGVHERMSALRGWAKRGERLHGLVSGRRGTRTNIIGAWNCKLGLVTTKTYTKTTINREVFLEWVVQNLTPFLKAGKMVIMDNAPWHKCKKIREAIEKTGAKLLLLPPYSPDLNPTQHAWANLKHKIRQLDNFFMPMALKIFTAILQLNLKRNQ